jgi:hypothetical protein
MTRTLTTFVLGMLLIAKLAAAQTTMFTAPHDAAWMGSHGFRSVATTVNGRPAHSWYCDGTIQTNGSCGVGAQQTSLAPVPVPPPLTANPPITVKEGPLPHKVVLQKMAPLPPDEPPVRIISGGISRADTGDVDTVEKLQLAVLNGRIGISRDLFVQLGENWVDVQSWTVPGDGKLENKINERKLVDWLGRLDIKPCDVEEAKDLSRVSVLDGITIKYSPPMKACPSQKWFAYKGKPFMTTGTSLQLLQPADPTQYAVR